MTTVKSKNSTAEGSTSNVEDGAAELESHFILRLPIDAANNVRSWLQQGDDAFKDKLQINFNADMRHAQVKVDKEILNGTLMDLPTIVETLKTIDKKNFYKVADCPQLLICKREGEDDTDIFKKKKTSAKPQKIASENKQGSVEDPKKKDKQYQYPHGIAPPLKNVKKRRFRKTLKKKYMDAPELEKELKRLLRTDLEAVSVRWEVVTPEQEASEKSRNKTVSEISGGRNIEVPAALLNKSGDSIKADDLFGGALSSTSSSEGEDEDDEALGRQLVQQQSQLTNDESSKDASTSTVTPLNRPETTFPEDLS